MVERGSGRRLGLAEALARGPLLLDAAMGTRLMALGLKLDGDDPALWNRARPEAVARVHRLDLEVGSDAILTNTFGANRAWLGRFGQADRADDLNRRAAALAREAAGPSRYVIGCLGPTAAGLPGAYEEQAEALAGAGVDALIFETHTLDQAEAALRAVRGRVGLPILISLVAWPEPPGEPEAVRRLADAGASALGCNCQVGLDATLALMGRLRRATGLPLLAKPSAGLPGEPVAAPESFAIAVPGLLDRGVRLLGGCCGSTEAHVAALRGAIDASWPGEQQGESYP